MLNRKSIILGICVSSFGPQTVYIKVNTPSDDATHDILHSYYVFNKNEAKKQKATAQDWNHFSQQWLDLLTEWSY